jgi:protein-tyrosine phosphatase
MEIHRIHPEGALFVSGEIDDWELIRAHQIDTIIDLDGGIDEGIPQVANEILYVYFPMNDDEYLPNATKLDALGRFIASLVDARHVVLVHCLIGLNRSNLVAAMALTYLGMSGADAVRRLQTVQPAALYNDAFAKYAASLPARRVRVEHIEEREAAELREE